VYLVFESDKSVRALLQDCTEDLLHPEGYSEYYFKMSSRRMRCKDVSLSLSNMCRWPWLCMFGSFKLKCYTKKVSVWVNNAC